MMMAIEFYLLYTHITQYVILKKYLLFGESYHHHMHKYMYIHTQVEKENDLCCEGGMGSAEIEKRIDCPLILRTFFLLSLLLTHQKSNERQAGSRNVESRKSTFIRVGIGHVLYVFICELNSFLHFLQQSERETLLFQIVVSLRCFRTPILIRSEFL